RLPSSMISFSVLILTDRVVRFSFMYFSAICSGEAELPMKKYQPRNKHTMTAAAALTLYIQTLVMFLPRSILITGACWDNNCRKRSFFSWSDAAFELCFAAK